MAKITVHCCPSVMQCTGWAIPIQPQTRVRDVLRSVSGAVSHDWSELALEVENVTPPPGVLAGDAVLSEVVSKFPSATFKVVLGGKGANSAGKERASSVADGGDAPDEAAIRKLYKTLHPSGRESNATKQACAVLVHHNANNRATAVEALNSLPISDVCKYAKDTVEGLKKILLNPTEEQATLSRATALISRISTSNEGRADLMGGGIVPVLQKAVQQHRSSRAIDSIVHCAVNLMNSDGEARTAFSTSDAIANMVKVVTNTTAASASATAAVLNALSLICRDDTARGRVVKQNGIEALVSMLKAHGGQPQLLSSALTLLANLSLEEGALACLHDARAVTCIISFLTSEHEALHLKCIWCLANALVDEECQDEFMAANGCERLVPFLGSADATVARKAASAIANLTEHSDAYREVLGEHGAVAYLVHNLNECPRDKARDVLIALSNLSLCFTNEVLFHTEQACFDRAIRIATDGADDAETREIALMLLSTLAANEDFRVRIRRTEGAIAGICEMLADPNEQIKLEATRCVANLAMDGSIRYHIASKTKATEHLRTLHFARGELKALADVALVQLSFGHDADDEAEDADHEQNMISGSDTSSSTHSDAAVPSDAGGAGSVARDASNPLSVPAAVSASAVSSAGRMRAATMGIQGKGMNNSKKREDRIKQMETAGLKSKFERLLAATRQKEEEALVELSNKGQTMNQILEDGAKKAKKTMKKRMTASPKKSRKKDKGEDDGKEEKEKKKDRSRRSSSPLVDKVRRTSTSDRTEKEKKKKDRDSGGGDRLKKLKKSRRTQSDQPAVSRSESSSEGIGAESPRISGIVDRRTNIALEMLATEVTYVDGLSVLVKKYMRPMLAASSSKRPPIHREDVVQMFANVEEIIRVNNMLLERLSRKITSFDSASTCIGEYFISFAEYLRRSKSYIKFVNNYDNAIRILHEHEARESFAHFLQKLTDSNIKGMAIYSYFIMPVQRVPRYIMLLQDLLKHTGEDHPDYTALTEAVEKVSLAMREIDDGKDQYEASRGVHDVLRQISGLPSMDQQLLATDRVLVKDGALTSNGTKFHAFLFNDVFILTKKDKKEKQRRKYIYMEEMPMTNVKLFDYVDPVKCPVPTIYLQGKYVSKNLTFDEITEKSFWLAAFEQAIDAPAQHLDCAPLPI